MQPICMMVVRYVTLEHTRADVPTPPLASFRIKSPLFFVKLYVYSTPKWCICMLRFVGMKTFDDVHIRSSIRAFILCNRLCAKQK